MINIIIMAFVLMLICFVFGSLTEWLFITGKASILNPKIHDVDWRFMVLMSFGLGVLEVLALLCVVLLITGID